MPCRSARVGYSAQDPDSSILLVQILGASNPASSSRIPAISVKGIEGLTSFLLQLGPVLFRASPKQGKGWEGKLTKQKAAVNTLLLKTNYLKPGRFGEPVYLATT